MDGLFEKSFIPPRAFLNIISARDCEALESYPFEELTEAQLPLALAAAVVGADAVMVKTVIRKLKACGKPPSFKFKYYGKFTLLTLACCGNSDVVRVLLDEGASVWDRDSNGQYPKVYCTSVVPRNVPRIQIQGVKKRVDPPQFVWNALRVLLKTFADRDNTM